MTAQMTDRASRLSQPAVPSRLQESLGIAKIGLFQPACAELFLHNSYTGGMCRSFPQQNQIIGKVRRFRRDERILEQVIA